MRHLLVSHFSVLGIAGYSYLKAEVGCGFCHPGGREGRRETTEGMGSSRGMLFQIIRRSPGITRWKSRPVKSFQAAGSLR